MATEERLRHIVAVVEAAFRQHGPMTIRALSGIIGYSPSAIYPIVQPPRYRRVRLYRGTGGGKSAIVWRLAEEESE